MEAQIKIIAADKVETLQWFEEMFPEFLVTEEDLEESSKITLSNYEEVSQEVQIELLSFLQKNRQDFNGLSYK